MMWAARAPSAREIDARLPPARRSPRRAPLDLERAADQARLQDPGAFFVHLLPAFWSNLGKRLIRVPKLLLLDCSFLHAFQGVADEDALLGHPSYGPSWVGFALESVLGRLKPEVGALFYRDSNGSELDLILERGRERLAEEFKAGSARVLGTRMRHALEAVGAGRLIEVELDDHPSILVRWRNAG